MRVEMVMKERWKGWMFQQVLANHWRNEILEAGHDLHMELVPYWQVLVSRVPTKQLQDAIVNMSGETHRQWKAWQTQMHTVMLLSTPPVNQSMGLYLQPLIQEFPPPARVVSWGRRWSVPLTALTILPLRPLEWMATETKLLNSRVTRALRCTDESAALARSRKNSRSAT